METNISSEPLNDNPNIELWDNSKRAKNLITVFWILIALSIIGLISSYFELRLLRSIQDGYFVTDFDAEANDLRQGIIGLLEMGVYIFSIVVFLKWFRRAYGNLNRINTNSFPHKDSTAVWCWIIPFVSLFKPAQIMSQIWKETQASIKKYDPSYSIKHGGILIGIWWTLFIISNFVGRYILKTAFKQDTIEQMISSTEATILADFLQIPEALLVVAIVFQLSKMEKKLSEQIQINGGKVVQISN